MTHYAALSEAVTRKPAGQGRFLTFRWSEVPIRELIEHLADGGELDLFLASHSSVKGYHARLVRDIWHNIRPEADTQQDAWRQLRQQADWARVSEVVSARIERKPVEFADPPTRDQYLSLVREATDELGIESDPSRPPNDPEGSRRERWERRDARHHAYPSASEEAVDQLSDAAIHLERSVDLLSQDSHPALSSYAEILVNRVDEILAEVRDRPKGD